MCRRGVVTAGRYPAAAADLRIMTAGVVHLLYEMSRNERIAALPQRRSPPMRWCHVGAVVQDSAK